MIIYHITPKQRWDEAKEVMQYIAPSLETEGFIHASTLEQLVDTANRFYRGQQDLVLLAIDPDQVEAEVSFDPVFTHGKEQAFPHVYGPLNIDAVVDVMEFPPNEDGSFSLPASLTRRY